MSPLKKTKTKTKMEPRSSRMMIIALTATAMILTAVTAERTNNKSGGLYWSTAEEEAQAQLQPRVDDSAVDADFNADGGFSSLDSMLQWALGHSDPDQLKEAAKEVQGLSSSELSKKRLEIRQLMEELKTPSDAQMMKVAILDLKNSSLPLGDRHRALEELLELVEPIDNANDLNKLGGLAVVIGELDHSDSETRKMAAWIIGKASQNNPLLQKQVLELGALSKLMEMVKSSFVEEAIKAMYAVSALLRNNKVGQEMFYEGSWEVLLQDIVSNSSISNRLRIRAVVLVGDLAEFQLENTLFMDVYGSFLCNHIFLKSVVDLTSVADLHLQEKVLTAIKNLLRLKTTEALVFKDFCGLDAALERMRQRLQDLMVEEYHRDYAMDVESLRNEVQLIFQRKLEKETRMTA